VEKLPEKKYSKVYELPITHTAQEELGKSLFANIIALGAIAKITGVVTIESLTKAVLSKVPKGTEAINEKALQLGMDMVK